jgi:two-component system CheB/CheR fusion protein
MQAQLLRARRVSRQFCVAIGAYAFMGGVASLCGWPLDIPRLTDWAGTGISIQPNAALCATLSGLALMLLAIGYPRLGTALALGVVAIAGLTLLEWVAGVDTGLAPLMNFDREWGNAAVVRRGRMGIPSSVSWTLLGACLVLSGTLPADARRRRELLKVALFTFGLGLLSVTGYLYGAEALYTLPRTTAIALQTATFIVAVSAGVIALHPDRAPMRWLVRDSAVGVVARRALVAVLLIPIALGGFTLWGERVGLYDESFGRALMVLLLTAALGLILAHGLSILAKHEADLLNSEQRLQLAIMAADAATLDKDLQNDTDTQSDSFYRTLGHVPAAARESPKDFWKSVVVPEDLPAVLKEWDRARTSRDLFRSEYRLRRADGSVLWARSAGRFFYDEAGHAMRFVGVVVDVTDEKRAIESLREADRRKDEFLAMLAHELRNPLAPVRNALSILKLKSPASPEQQWARDLIDRQMQQMTRMIDDLLDVNRIRRGKIELKREHLELEKAVQSAVEASRPLIDQYGHELTVTLPPEPIIVDADLARLAQVFCNLLNNAARYTPRGGRIAIGAETEGTSVLVRIRDNGIGIPPEMQPNVFDMFMQVDRSLERARGGLGIGLTLVKQLVVLHGGAVEVRSEGLGKGCEFVVRLPLPQDLPERAAPVATLHVPSIPTAGHRILIVDDNKDSVESLGMLLRMMGNQTRTAHDGIEGLTIAREYRPDVVLMDIGLPGLNGYDAARAIRKEPWGADMMLVALTGWGQDSDRRRSKAAGFDYHLVKPVTLEALMSVLSSLEPAPEKAATGN